MSTNPPTGPFRSGDNVITETSLRHNHTCIATGITLPSNTKSRIIPISTQKFLIFGTITEFSAHLHPDVIPKQNRIHYTVAACIAIPWIIAITLFGLETPAINLPFLTAITLYQFLQHKIHPLKKLKVTNHQNNLYSIKGTHPNYLKSLPTLTSPQ